MRENSPEKTGYFNAWLGFPYEKLYRIEVTLSNAEMRELCEASAKWHSEWDHGGNLINLVRQPSFLQFAFRHALSHVLRFKDGSKEIEVWEL